MNAFFLSITCFSSSRATGRQPFLKYTFCRRAEPQHVLSPLGHGLDVEQMLDAHVLATRSCRPRSRSPGSGREPSLKLYRSPMPPWEEGVLTRMRQVFIRAAKSRPSSAGSVGVEVDGGGVAVAAVGNQLLGLVEGLVEGPWHWYMASTGESFSWANSSADVDAARLRR